MLKFRSICVISILAVVMLSMPYSISANVPPPIENLTTGSGGLYTTATNISMPYAEVNASIHLSGSWYYNISVSCTFYVLSLTSQNLTTAFVYPSIWTWWIDYPEVIVNDFNILVNESLVNQSILSYDEFKIRYDTNQTDWEKVEDCDFATFNFTINSGEPIFIDVIVNFSTFSPAHNFIFDYIVDTARGWEGDTREIVTFEFSRDLDTEIIEYRYYPEEALDFSGNNYTASVNWDFHISNFEYDRVTFIVQQREYPEYRFIPPPSPFPWIPTIILGSAIVVVVVIVTKTGKQ